MEQMPVYIIAERRRGRITQETHELLGFARAVGEGQMPVVLLPGKDSAESAGELADKTGCSTVALSGDHLEFYNGPAYSEAVMEFLRGMTTGWVCLAHTSMGYDLAPRLAVQLEASCVTAVDAAGDGWLGRPVYSGRFREEIAPQTPVVVVTVLPGAFQAPASGAVLDGRHKIIEVREGEAASKTIGVAESLHRDSRLKDAEVIVAGGRGIGKKENVALLEELAAVFPRSAVGASRSACDLGWFQHRQQIGTTGLSVSPKLYIACGISGAFQHVSGIRGAQSIVAINTDPHASIFQSAHYCIREDLVTFIPILIEELKR
ncbi:MAG: electron transfer flavoprotein subunit alpha/FixB family protein [Desulfobacteraceae bacterium]|nr:MAG: electron transfer flavoprotein subunit alpha/FixB family protein [Desulfobacteraceae bacterium]